MGFIILFLLLLWLFQVVFLQGTYQLLKIRDIEKVAATILNESGSANYEEILNRAAYDNNMCILITDKYGFSPLYSVDVMAGNCEIHNKADTTLYKYRQRVLNTENGMLISKIFNEHIKSQTILFGLVIGTKEDPQGFIFLNTSIDPLNSTISILEEQMVYLTIILLTAGLILSFFMARRLANPIVKITKSAEKLATGNYDVNFDGEGYDEVERLASTLNYASYEISKVDHLRKELIANISHDLRTPLTMVKAYAEMIRDLSGDNPVKRAEHLGVIIEESNRLAALVNDILDLSRIESTSQSLNLSEFNITDKLNEILERYKLLSEQQGYVFNFQKDENVKVKCDILKIEQVIYNLINNAVNYTGKNKLIIIRQINTPKYIRIEIIDSGAGIPPDQLALIFDRYYRTDKSQREVIGTGLGLSIVQAILKQHNFPYGVQSKVGEGSTFWFQITR